MLFGVFSRRGRPILSIEAKPPVRHPVDRKIRGQDGAMKFSTPADAILGAISRGMKQGDGFVLLLTEDNQWPGRPSSPGIGFDLSGKPLSSASLPSWLAAQADAAPSTSASATASTATFG